MAADNPTDYLSLRQFPTGPGWITRLEDAASRYAHAGTIITPADIETARQYCKGEIVETLPLGPDDWALAVQPFEDVRLLFKFTRDEEFGDALHFYVHQAARGQVATEDLAFLLDFYLQILGQRNLLYTLIGIPPESHVPIHLFPKMEVPIEDIQRIYFSLQLLSRELDSKIKLERATVFTRAELQDEIGTDSLCQTLAVAPTLNIILRFQFSSKGTTPVGVTASDALAYLPSNLVLYLVAAYANAFARAVGSQYRVNFHGLCHYFHVTKFE
jgi:hypothetical protein